MHLGSNKWFIIIIIIIIIDVSSSFHEQFPGEVSALSCTQILSCKCHICEAKNDWNCVLGSDNYLKSTKFV
jgi:hypothetical protein